MAKTSGSPVQDVVGSLMGRLRYPWVFALLGALFLADLVVPDPIPFVDEVMLAILTFLLGTWRSRKKDPPDVVVDVSPSPPNESGG